MVAAVGIAVALAADKEGLAQAELNSPVQQIHQAMWRPAYTNPCEHSQIAFIALAIGAWRNCARIGLRASVATG
jgi:hypothetical protein